MKNLFKTLVEMTKQIAELKSSINLLESIDTDEAAKEHQRKILEKMKLTNERGLVFKQYIKKIGVKYTDKQATDKVWDRIFAKC